MRDLDRIPLLRRFSAAAAGSGQRLYVMGGFLRDRIMGISPKAELDLTVRDSRSFVERLDLRDGESSFLMDAERQTYRLVFSNPAPFRWVDITRLRAGSIEDDLRLRDFTVNALAMLFGPGGAKGMILDPTGGLADISRGRLRACSARSFRDDPLRTLRGIRFAGTLSFTIQEETLRLMTSSGSGLRRVAAERVRDEFFQVLQGTAPEKGLRMILEIGLLRHFGNPFDNPRPSSLKRLRRLRALLGEFHPHSSVSRKLGAGLDQVATRRGILLLATFLLDTGTGERTPALVRRLALGKNAGRALETLVREPLPASVLRHLGRVRRETTLGLFRRADAVAEEAALLGACALTPAATRKEAVTGFLRKYRAARRIFLRPPLLPGRAALDHLPVSPGPALGELLRKNREAQDLGRFRTFQGALRWARKDLADTDR